MSYRVLSLDGGGIKGAFQASFLAAIEDSIGNRVSNYFDLIVGTSTGGIIALGLGAGLSAREILSFYEKDGPVIFPRARRWNFPNWVVSSRYKSSGLRQVLSSKFSDLKLGSSKNRLVVTSFNLDLGKHYLFKTAHHTRFETDYKRTMVDVAMATSAAPAYFPTHRAAFGEPMLDGAVVANNPVLIAAMEATQVLEWPKEQVEILSVGCTQSALALDMAKKYPMGLGYWGKQSPNVFLAAQSEHAMAMTTVLLNGRQIYRVSPNVGEGQFDLDKLDGIPSLVGHGHTAARDNIPALRERFFSTPAQPFTPVYKLDEIPVRSRKLISLSETKGRELEPTVF